MPPFPIKSPTTGNDLPSMRKEGYMIQLAIVRAREEDETGRGDEDGWEGGREGGRRGR